MIAARLALLLPLALALSGFAPQDADPFAGFPNVQFVYYDVSGTTPAAIRKEMNEKGPTEDASGKRFDGHTRYRFNWRWRGKAGGGCDLENVELKFEAVVTLPRLVDETRLSKSTRERWAKYHRALIEHEAGHVRIAWEGREAVAAAIKGATCDTANQAGAAAIDHINRQQRDYDAETRHGMAKGAVFP